MMVSLGVWQLHVWSSKAIDQAGSLKGRPCLALLAQAGSLLRGTQGISATPPLPLPSTHQAQQQLREGHNVGAGALRQVQEGKVALACRGWRLMGIPSCKRLPAALRLQHGTQAIRQLRRACKAARLWGFPVPIQPVPLPHL